MAEYPPGKDGREEQTMLRLIAVAAVAVIMGAIGVSMGEERITGYLTGSQSVPHVVSTFFFGLSGR